jgi:Plastocyanin
MKRRNLLLLMLIFSISISTIMCSKSSSYNGGSNPPPTPTGSTVTVTISGMAFSPASVTVKTGTTILWKNNDAMTHTATSDDGSTFNTGNILAGYTGSATASKTGTFPYHCAIHSSMTGTVIVTP